MHLRGHEVIRRVYRRHYFPFLLNVLKLLAASFPFFFLLYLIQGGMSPGAFFVTALSIALLFLLAFFYIFFIYWADKLIITNFRVIFIDWKLLNVNTENEAELKDIQDIHIRAKGILSFIPFLNYGTLTIATAASEVCVRFEYAPDPDAVKRFIFTVR